MSDWWNNPIAPRGHKIAYTSDGMPYFVPDDEEEPLPEGDELGKIKRDEIGNFIAEIEAISQAPSPLREAVAPPTQGIDASPLRIETPDPVEAALGIAPEPLPQLEDRVTHTEGKVPEQRMDLKKASDYLSPEARALSTVPGLTPQNTDTLRDAALAPFVKAYQAGTGQMSSAQQEEFALQGLLDSIGMLGGPVSGAIGTLVSPAVAADNPPTGPEALVPVQIETIGGPALISPDELKLIGGLAAVSMGMAFAPQVFSKLKGNLLPKFGQTRPSFRPVKNAAPGTVAMSTPIDLARTYDDVNAGALRLLKRAGVSQSAVDRVTKTFRLQTRSTTNALTESAVRVGEMGTPNFTFKVKTPLDSLIKLENPQVNEYLHVLDTIDDIKIKSLTRKAMANPQPGTPVVRGLDLQAASQLKKNLELANPQLKDISREYRDNLRAMRRFESEGEYATLSPLKRRLLSTHRGNEVPFQGGRTNDPDFDRGSAMTNLATTMRERLRARMENEAVGQYVDEMLKVQPDTFKRVTNEMLTDNPNWNRNVVQFYRRGKLEKYTTDPFLADVLRMDPYYMSSNAQNIVYSTKRLMEMATTGELAPWFAVTSMLRSWQIGKITATEGMKSPTFLGSMKAIPQQLYPQMAKEISKFLDNRSNGWLASVFGQGNMQGLSTRLARQYDNSLFAEMQAVGGGRGSIMQQQTQANSRLTKAISESRGWAKATLEGYRTLLNSVHNAPAFNYASRNRGKKSAFELAADARHMTGDPRIGGQYYSGDKGRIRFETNSPGADAGRQIAELYGLGTELGRTALPWYNATVQGMKRIGEAYVDNPTKFVGRAWLYQGMPAASLYMFSRSLGNDPNGQSYVDYQMNRRSEYQKTMFFYIPIPGRPAEEGIEFPRFHEATPVGHLTEVAMDHAFRSNVFPMGEDFKRAASGIGGILEPAWPPLASLALAHHGMIAPQGPWTGEAYKKRTDPNDQLGGLPPAIELYARAAVPGIADVVGAGYAAASAPNQSAFERAMSGIGGVRDRVIEKTPLVRDILGMTRPASGSNAIVTELFARRKVIDELDNHYRTWMRHKGLIGVKTQGDKLVPSGSVAGNEIATQRLGERLPSQPAGLGQPTPTNPLFEMFIEAVHDTFKTDREMGFLSLTTRYSDATKQIQRMRRVNKGNHVTWQRHLDNQPEMKKRLIKEGINYKNPRDVMNFLERTRQDAAREILNTIKQVEAEFSAEAGRPIKLEDIRPYGRGIEPSGGEAEPEATPY